MKSVIVRFYHQRLIAVLLLSACFMVTLMGHWQAITTHQTMLENISPGDDASRLLAWGDAPAVAARPHHHQQPSSSAQHCLHNRFFDPIQWGAAAKAGADFHSRGGNLKSIQRLQDSTMDATAGVLGLTFLADEDGSNTTTTTTTRKVQTKPSKYLRRYYAEHYDPRGGYGKPLPGAWKQQDEADPAVLMEKRWLNAGLEPTRGRLRWDAGLGPVGPECPNLLRLGTQEGDGYKFYCNPLPPSSSLGQRIADDSGNSRNSSSSSSGGGACHVISVGGNDNWKFEEAVVAEMGCDTHTFDCTLPGDGLPKRKPDDARVHFYPYCLDGVTRNDTHGRQYLSYGDMLEVAGVRNAPPAYLKIDVEGFEYDIFHQMVGDSSSGPSSMMMLPTQIQVELHWATRMTGVEWMMRTRSSAEIALFSSMMYHAGYLPILLDFNPHCASCMEVLYFRSATTTAASKCYD